MQRHVSHYGRALKSLNRATFVSASSQSVAYRFYSEEASPKASELIYPDPPTTQHYDLPSFLSHTERTGSSKRSTVYVGTLYEYTIAATLSRYGFHLKRIGGTGDFGTDLLGTWTLPSTTHPIKVLIQCKAGAQRISPNHIRELEGAFAGAPVGWRGDRVLALLVSQKDATKGVRDALGRSKLPMGYLCCDKNGKVRQMLWNRRAAEEGLEGFGVTTRFGDEEGEEELVLVRDGEMLPLLD